MSKDYSRPFSRFGKLSQWGLAALLSIGLTANSLLLALAIQLYRDPVRWPESRRVGILTESNPALGLVDATVSDANLFDWRRSATALSSIGAYTYAEPLLRMGGDPIRLASLGITRELAFLLGRQAAVGRLLQEADFEAGSPAVAVLTFSCWRSRFGMDPSVVGRTIEMEGRATVIVGVSSDEVLFPFPLETRPISAFLPLVLSEASSSRRGHYLRSIGLLKDGSTWPQAQAQLLQISRHLQAQYPRSNAGWTANIRPLQDAVFRQTRPALVSLMVLSGSLFLLVSITMTLNLIEAVAASAKDFSVRAALGASEIENYRLVLTKSCRLAAGGALGAAVLMPVLWRTMRLSPSFESLRIRALIADPVPFGLLILGATAVVLACGASLAGWIAIRPYSKVCVELLRTQQPGYSGGRRWVWHFSVAAQLMVCVAVTAISYQLMQQYRQLTAPIRSGSLDRITVAEVRLPARTYAEPSARVRVMRDLENSLNSTPNVEYAGLAAEINNEFADPVSVSAAHSAGLSAIPARANVVSSNYFRVMKALLLAGDLEQLRFAGPAKETPIAVNAAFLKAWTYSRSPLREVVYLNAKRESAFRVVAIVQNLPSPGFTEPLPMIYLPHGLAEGTAFARMHLVLRASSASTPNLSSIIRSSFQGVDPTLFPEQVVQFQELIDIPLMMPRLRLGLLAILFGLTALLCSFSVQSTAAALRRKYAREFAIRQAHGAPPASIGLLHFKRSLPVLVLSLAAGGVLAFVVSRAYEGATASTLPAKRSALFVAAGLVTGLFCAGIGPSAWQAIRQEPGNLLRQEG